MTELTQKQCRILDDVERLLISLLRGKEEALMFSLHGGWERMDCTYFSPSGAQHSNLLGWQKDVSLSNRINAALEIRNAEDANAENAKAQRIEELKAEIERLEAK